MKKMISLTLALMMSLSLCSAALAAGNDGFSDVGESDWYYSDVMACAEQGIVTGYEDGTFRPGDEVTGIQFIVMLTRTFYSGEVEAARETETSSWYAPNMKAANDVGMLKIGQFTLTVNEDAMNRYDMAVILSNIIAAKDKNATKAQRNDAVSAIKDNSKIPATYTYAVQNCYALGIITGMSDGTFSGNSNMNRAQACTVVSRMLNLLGGSTSTGTTMQQPVADEKLNSDAAVSGLTLTSSDDGYGSTKWTLSETNNTDGTLSNGKPITEDNIQEIISMLRNTLPDGILWTDQCDGNNYYDYYAHEGRTIQRTILNKYNASPQYACSGFVALVSDAIFGHNANPGRMVPVTADM